MELSSNVTTSKDSIREEEYSANSTDDGRKVRFGGVRVYVSSSSCSSNSSNNSSCSTFDCVEHYERTFPKQRCTAVRQRQVTPRFQLRTDEEANFRNWFWMTSSARTWHCLYCTGRLSSCCFFRNHSLTISHGSNFETDRRRLLVSIL